MIIAECSQNFTDLAEAKNLVALAWEGEADLVKFQLFDSAKLYKEKSPAELTFCDAKMLFNYGEELGIEVFFSVFDVERVKWCEEIGVKRYKLASSIDSEDVFLAVHKTLKPIIRSVHPFIYRKGGKPLSVVTKYMMSDKPEEKTLYCIPDYPAKINGLELCRIEQYDGFSDHTIGLDASKIALARGAEIIEKHFCIDHKTGIDAPWSMTPEELKELKRWETVCKQVL